MFNVRMAHHEEPQVSIHLLSAVPHGLYVEIFANPERDPMWRELVTNRPAIVDGTVAVPKGPGLGLELDEAVIERYSGYGLSV
jgi:D-arabinonate dehydratase